MAVQDKGWSEQPGAAGTSPAALVLPGCREAAFLLEKKCQGRERPYVRIILLLVRGACHGALSGLDFSCLHKAHNAGGIHV